MWIKISLARTGWRAEAGVLSLAALNDHTAFFLGFCLPTGPNTLPQMGRVLCLSRPGILYVFLRLETDVHSLGVSLPFRV